MVFAGGVANTIPAKPLLVAEYKAPGLEMELAGIYPHPTDDNLYFVLANNNPVYQAGQSPMLPAHYRGKLLTVNRYTGEVVKAFPLVNGEYGGLAYGTNHLYVASLEPAEILKVDPATGSIMRRLPVAGPIGGLEYDKDRSMLIAQLFVGFPHLALIDPESGTTVETLWSDESAMGLAKVNGDLLCTWTSGFDEYAFSELRILDQTTGKVKSRSPLAGVHSSLAPLDKKVAGIEGFISLVAERTSGKVVVQKYAYQQDH
jgi:hypothetical protein